MEGYDGGVGGSVSAGACKMSDITTEGCKALLITNTHMMRAAKQGGKSV